MENIESKGLGDTIAKVTHALHIDEAVKRTAAMFGTDCGCAKRQEQLNQMFPYSKTEIHQENQLNEE